MAALALRDLLEPHHATTARPYVYAFPGGARDLGALLTSLRTQLTREIAGLPQGATPTMGELSRAIDQASGALDEAVVARALGSRYQDAPYGGMRGISVWLPPGQGSYQADLSWYAAARFYRPEAGASQPGHWREWLDALYAPLEDSF